jgi:hypothetical protein
LSFKENFLVSRYRILASILLLYLLPIISLGAYASISHGISVMGLGILLGSCGATALFMQMRSWEEPSLLTERVVAYSEIEEEPFLPPVGNEAENIHSVEKSALLEAERLISTLKEEKNSWLQESQHVQKDHAALKRQMEAITYEFKEYQQSIKQQNQETEHLLLEHQKTIAEQRDHLQKKQQQVLQLESHIRDLNYEIKAILEANDTLRYQHGSIIKFPVELAAAAANEEPDLFSLISEKQISSSEEAAKQLKRCLDIAQKITGASCFLGRPSRLRDFSTANQALDMRSLFDSLRSENGATILLYSQKDNKLLFVNNPIRHLVGWSPEKFVQRFHQLLADGGDSWNSSLGQLAFKNETQTTLLLETKNGQHMPINCHLGLIPTGSFRHHIIGVLYIQG